MAVPVSHSQACKKKRLLHQVSRVNSQCLSVLVIPFLLVIALASLSLCLLLLLLLRVAHGVIFTCNLQESTRTQC